MVKEAFTVFSFISLQMCGYFNKGFWLAMWRSSSVVLASIVCFGWALVTDRLSLIDR